MGTRCEIYIRNGGTVVGLWKMYDGYPEFMVPMLEGFLRYAVECFRGQPHLATYPEDLAALLIWWYREFEEEERKKRGLKEGVNCDVRPLFDVMGRKVIGDAEYVYVINVVVVKGQGLRYEIQGYKLAAWTGLDGDGVRELVDTGGLTGDKYIPVCSKVLFFK